MHHLSHPPSLFLPVSLLSLLYPLSLFLPHFFFYHSALSLSIPLPLSLSLSLLSLSLSFLSLSLSLSLSLYPPALSLSCLFLVWCGIAALPRSACKHLIRA